jgi:hypothetical protein
MTVGPNSSWTYEPDQVPKRKHHWAKPEAGFERIGKYRVGKCPAAMSLDEAQALLERAIPWSPSNWRRSYPQRLYAVRDGVLYRATPTNPGTSYHGFPEVPNRFPAGASSLQASLLAQARELNCEAELREWMNW